ncbi:phage phi LC3 family holin [Enterococcus sp. 8G7_MSG3316]|uniref:Phage phi LC3 family holin n=1 Tax=Candidatus Enterococcus testudinis TaxID=1834191 RepID=A0A242A6R4_9ENTE|nr:phage holin [Enterococcus sp. 8G7_MSG3316]OTN76714.1 phage phi LC3 family holin [Enterococcus sp. 8G7_MSG3316]
MKINWKVRFNKQNVVFWMRFAFAVFIPILVYMGLEVTDLDTWESLGSVLLAAISNPYLVGLTIVNALNLIPDPTTEGISDSNLAMTYQEPKKDTMLDYGEGQEFTENTNYHTELKDEE